jgi:hypothetical protein
MLGLHGKLCSMFARKKENKAKMLAGAETSDGGSDVVWEIGKKSQE